MLKATPENYKCCIYRMIDLRSDNLNFIGMVKTFFMVADVRLISEDPNDELSEGEVRKIVSLFILPFKILTFTKNTALSLFSQNSLMFYQNLICLVS